MICNFTTDVILRTQDIISINRGKTLPRRRGRGARRGGRALLGLMFEYFPLFLQGQQEQLQREQQLVLQKSQQLEQQLRQWQQQEGGVQPRQLQQAEQQMRQQKREQVQQQERGMCGVAWRGRGDISLHLVLCLTPASVGAHHNVLRQYTAPPLRTMWDGGDDGRWSVTGTM